MTLLDERRLAVRGIGCDQQEGEHPDRVVDETADPRQDGLEQRPEELVDQVAHDPSASGHPSELVRIWTIVPAISTAAYVLVSDISSCAVGRGDRSTRDTSKPGRGHSGLRTPA